jgi:dienelactone hydrolase
MRRTIHSVPPAVDFRTVLDEDAAVGLEGFAESTFTDRGVTRTVYRRGTGPGVVIVHEIPGIIPQVAEFGRRVADTGLTAVLPVLFGTPGKPLSTGYLVQQIGLACIRREFTTFALGKSSPVTEWLRGLCRQVHAECGGPGVGAIGMCLTGGYALALMVDPSVMAPVLSQPSCPLPISAAHRAAIDVSPAELSVVKRRVAEGTPVLGLRFTRDRACPVERFDLLRRELGDGFEAIEIDSGPGNPHGIPQSAHSVLTVDLVDRPGHPTRAALERVLAFFRERLLHREAP